MASTTIPSPEAPALASADGPEGTDTDDATPQDLEEVLIVELRGRAYALSASLVREVAPAGRLTPLPGAPDWVLGLAAVRGALMPVADLARRALAIESDAASDGATEAGSATRDGWLVVVDDGRRCAALVGVRVRGVAQARAVDDAPHVDEPRHLATSPAVPSVDGLPVRGAVRLLDEGRHRAGAGPVRLTRRARARAAARPPVPYGTGTHPELARLDVHALLDDLLDQGG